MEIVWDNRKWSLILFSTKTAPLDRLCVTYGSSPDFCSDLYFRFSKQIFGVWTHPPPRIPPAPMFPEGDRKSFTVLQPPVRDFLYYGTYDIIIAGVSAKSVTPFDFPQKRKRSPVVCTHTGIYSLFTFLTLFSKMNSLTPPSKIAPKVWSVDTFSARKCLWLCWKCEMTHDTLTRPRVGYP